MGYVLKPPTPPPLSPKHTHTLSFVKQCANAHFQITLDMPVFCAPDFVAATKFVLPATISQFVTRSYNDPYIRSRGTDASGAHDEEPPEEVLNCPRMFIESLLARFPRALFPLCSQQEQEYSDDEAEQRAKAGARWFS